MFAKPLHRVYLIGFVFSLGIALTAYVNSTFLAKGFSEGFVSILFSAGALLTLVGLEVLPALLARQGARRTALGLLAVNLTALLAITITRDTNILAVAFIAFITTNSMVVYCLDIFIEHFSTGEKTGNARGAYLSIINLAWMLSPFAAGVIATQYGFSSLYFLVFILVVVTLFLFKYLFNHFQDRKYPHPSPLTSLRYVLKHRDIARIIAVNFSLQFFYSWMVIFTPIYLFNVIGFDWRVIGIIFTVMLSPFVLLEYPLGRLADAGFGTKRLLIGGLIVMVLSTAAFGLYGGASIAVFAVILFMTRVGASTVEVMSETYFFKKMSDSEAGIISLFRATPQIAYIFAPLLGTIILLSSTHQVLFITLAALLLVVAGIAGKLHDNR